MKLEMIVDLLGLTEEQEEQLKLKTLKEGNEIFKIEEVEEW